MSLQQEAITAAVALIPIFSKIGEASHGSGVLQEVCEKAYNTDIVSIGTS